MNKYRFLIFGIFFLLIFGLKKVDAYVYDLPLLGKIFYIDPGHGGRDPGAVYDFLYEKDITLLISKKLAQKIEKLGGTVLLTRTDDYDLSSINTNNKKRNDLFKRSKLINESLCDMYLSIHLNALSSSKWRGLQIFYDEINDENSIIADSFTNFLKNTLNHVRDSKVENGYYLHHHVTRPGILVEVGFITNPDDRYLLKQDSYQEKIASELSKAILNYYLY